MPFRDGTGPNGEGPASGRGLGLCKPEGGEQRPMFNERPRWGLRRNLQQGFGGRGGRGYGRGRNPRQDIGA